MAALLYQVISKEVENRIFRHYRIFRYICINNLFWQRSGIKIFLCKYANANCANMCSYLRYTNELLDLFFLLLAVILSELPKKERLSYIKKYIQEYAWETSLFWLHALLPMSFFCRFFLLLILFRLLGFYIEKKILLLKIAK